MWIKFCLHLCDFVACVSFYRWIVVSDNRLTPVGYIQSTNLVVTSKCLIDPRRICEGDWTPAPDAENNSSLFWQVPGLPSSHRSRQALALTSSYFMLWSIGKWTWVLGLYQHSSFQAFPFIFDSTVEMILKATLLFYWQRKIKLWGNTSLGNFFLFYWVSALTSILLNKARLQLLLKTR